VLFWCFKRGRNVFPLLRRRLFWRPASHAPYSAGRVQRVSSVLPAGDLLSRTVFAFEHPAPRYPSMHNENGKAAAWPFIGRLRVMHNLTLGGCGLDPIDSAREQRFKVPHQVAT
jgi:hypothetical protein